MKKPSRPMVFMLAFAGLNLLWRPIFLPVSQSSYTDGILQIDMFREGLSYWPPLYALLTRLFAWMPGLGLEGSGRLISFLAGVALVFPLAAAARRLFGLRAAIWAMAAWTISPMALQWSLQVMTDMPLTVLWMAALAALVIGVEAYLPGLFPPSDPARIPDARAGSRWLLLASLCGALATLTRYQGILLLPLTLLAVWKLWPISRRLPQRSFPLWLSLLPWLAVPAWLVKGMSSIVRHGAQFQERSSALGAWYNFEEFLLKSPYFITYGVFGFMLYGLLRTNWSTARLRWTGWVCLYLALAIFALQSFFSSYQSRYLLPLLPLVCLFAGHGLATWERRNQGRPLRFWSLALPAIALGLAFSALVATFQGSPFKDVKDAALFVRGLRLPDSRKIVSNEYYNAGIGPAKVSFWSGRRPAARLGAAPLNAGDVIILTSWNAGGLDNYRQIKKKLIESLPAKPLHAPFGRFALPLLPDLMAEPGTNQNPLAWYLRYQWQYFETSVLEVQASPGSEPLQPVPPPLADDPREQAIGRLKELQKEIHGGAKR